ncbi:MAG: dephospho-CoA kinase [Xanthomonadales bacterium]|nr:dephospho-CoA kinase [Xanthomonadales bacterium]
MTTGGEQSNQDGVFVVALTGGIASGKTTVANLFQKRGVDIVDTDLIARSLVEPGQPMLASVVAAFGQELLDAYGRLKRRKLRDIIFSQEEKREQLEAMMHPQIAVEARRLINRVQSPYCILVIPLLAEKGGFAGVDRVLVVDADADTQLGRLTDRDGVSEEQARHAMGAQVSRERRLSFADDVIRNDGSLAELEAEVDRLHQSYLVMSRAARGAP